MIADMRGKSALVVGGTRGIGNAVARALAKCGARVVLTGRDAGAARDAAAAIGQGTEGVALDVRDRLAIDAVVERVVEDLPAVDALVYSAGVSPSFKSGERIDPDDWDEILAVNLSGAFWCARAVAQTAIARGRPASIVLVGSIAGSSGAGRLAAYSASKAGLVGLAKSLAWDWARHGIRINVLAPGWVETEMTEGIRANASLSDWIRNRTPQARMAAPEEIADFAVFLASDSARFATGGVFPLDGGWTAG